MKNRGVTHTKIGSVVGCNMDTVYVLIIFQGKFRKQDGIASHAFLLLGATLMENQVTKHEVKKN